jgi:hypothetical protein
MAEIRIPVEKLPPPNKNGDHAFQFRIISVDKNQWSAWSQLYIIKSIGQYRPLESNVIPAVSAENVGLTWDTPIIYNYNSASLSSASISHNHSQDFKQHDTDVFVQWNSASTMADFQYHARVSEDFTSVSIPTSSYNKVSELLPLDLDPIDKYGDILSISADGNTAIIGAYLGSASVDSFNGVAYVFTRSGTTWTQQAKLAASDGAFFDSFGVSVSISADGNTALIGAASEDTSPNTNNGAAYVFTRSDTTWTQQVKLVASDAASGDNFGISVSISSNGNTALIGSPSKSTSPNTNNGAVYAFTRSDTTWTEREKIIPEDSKSSDLFGLLVSISGDGSTFAVSSDTDFVYVYELSGNTWRQQAKLFSTENLLNYNFGSDISVSEDGNTIAVGAYVTGSGGSFYTLGLGATAAPVFTESGGCHIFTRLNSDWTQKFRIIDTSLNSKNFGRAVSISGDANTLLLGIKTTNEETINGNANIYNLSIIDKFRAIGVVALKDVPKIETFDSLNNTEEYLLSISEFLFGNSDVYGPENPSLDSVYSLFKVFDTGIINV